MRSIASILAFYILALAFLPCADGINEHGTAAETDGVTIQTSSPCNEHNHNAADNCSPLCFCHCCHTHVSFPNVEVAVTEQHFNNEYSSFYTSFLSTSHLNSLFRPPRV